MWLIKVLDSRWDNSASLSNAIQTSQPLSGGLWTPQNGSLNIITPQYLNQMSRVTYQQVAFMVLRNFDFWIDSSKLKQIIDEAYGDQWHHSDITPVKQMGNDDIFSLHLWYGPTFAFKNAALEFLPRLLQAITKEKTFTVLGASSGDTINAAHHGVKGTSIRSIFMLPNSGPSEVQRLQAVNGIVANPNAFTILADAPFDPLQDVVKRINSSEYTDFKADHNITSFNSINIARILAQVVYYFRGYTQLIKLGKIKAGDFVNFSVPSGNFWDALAGLYAREMGLPIAKINVATNENDMLDKFFKTGTYQPPKHEGKDFVQVTNAPSQDIAKSSNFERALFWACDGDFSMIQDFYQSLAKNWYFKVPKNTLNKLKEVFTSSTSTDEQRFHIIKTMANAYRHWVDPHTATWLYPILNWNFWQGIPTIFLETSHVAQFWAELKSQWIIVPWMDEFDKTLDAMKSSTPQEWVHFLKTSWDFDDIFTKVQEAIQILDARK
jgi:threonine synthase